MLRPYQQKLIADTVAAARQRKRVLVQSPTGSGKSVIFSELIRRAVDKSRDVLFLVHRRELINQADKHLAKVGVDAGIVMAGIEPTPSAVQLASVQTLYRRLDRMDMGKYGLVIIDEAHHHGAKTYKEIVSRVNGAHVVGFTATPRRLGGSPLGDCFNALVIGPPIRELQALGFLCGVEYMSGKIPDLTGIKTTGGDYSEKGLHEKAVPQLVGGVVDHYLSYGGRKGIIFSCGQRHSIYLRDEFERHGKRATVIDSKTPEEERDDLIEEYRAADTGVLINHSIFLEGVDMPECDTAVMARPTKSLVVWLQGMGRGLRPWPGKTLLVIDHGANVYRHGFVEDDHEWNLTNSTDKEKLAVEQSERVKKYAACSVCGTMITGKRCHNCGHEVTRLEWARNVRELRNCGLKLIDKKDILAKKPHTATPAAWNSIAGYCALRGYSMGAAAHRFNARFGVLPWKAKLGLGLPRGQEWKLPARDWLEKALLNG